MEDNGKIEIVCPNPECQQRMRVANDKIGARVKCPKCQQILYPTLDDVVPAETAKDDPAAPKSLASAAAPEEVQRWSMVRTGLFVLQAAVSLVLLCNLGSVMLLFRSQGMVFAYLLLGGPIAGVASLLAVVALVLLVIYLPFRHGGKTFVIAALAAGAVAAVVFAASFLIFKSPFGRDVERPLFAAAVFVAVIAMLTAHVLFVSHFKSIGWTFEDRTLPKYVNVYLVCLFVGILLAPCAYGCLFVTDQGLGVRITNWFVEALFSGMGFLFGLFVPAFHWVIIGMARGTIATFLKEQEYLSERQSKSE